MLGARSAPSPTKPNAHAAVKPPVGPDAHQIGPELPKATFARPEPAGAAYGPSKKPVRGGRVQGGRGGASPSLVNTRISESPAASDRGSEGGQEGPAALAPEHPPGGLPKRPLKYIDACARNAWHLHLWGWDQKTGEVVWEKRANFKCQSWRHAGDCRRWRAAQNFARVSQALQDKRPRDVLYLVFTLDREKWKDRWEAFDELSARWRPLAKAIARQYATEGTYRQRKEKDHRTQRFVPKVPPWVGTVEVHRSGWPHLNVVMVAPRLADALDEDPKGTLEWLKRAASRCGFGWRCSIERASSKRALAGYIVKVAGEIETAAKPNATGRLVGEVIKLSQLPVDAKRHFRRLRSAKGFLPPPIKNPFASGRLLKEPPPPVTPRSL